MLSVLFGLTLAAIPCRGSTGCTVEVQVEGRAVPMLVDTGADLTVFTAEGARRAGIRVPPDAPIIAIQGAGGRSTAKLAFAEVSVGGFEEPGVLVAVMENLDLGRRAHGLLGMTYLERFKTQMGRSLELTPVDADAAEKRGGRGRAWWRLRFRQFGQRTPAFRRAIEQAERMDRQTQRTYGRSTSGDTVSARLKNLQAFLEKAERTLRNEAARYAVPQDWRR